MSTVETQPTTEIYPKAWLTRRRGLLILIIVLVALAALGFKCWRVYDRAQLVRADLRAIQALARSQRDQAMADALGARLAKMRGDTVALRAEAGLFLPVTRYLGWAPVYGGDLAAAEPLLDAAVDISAAADDAFAAFGPLLAEQPSAPITGARLREQIAAKQPQIDSAGAAIDRALAAWQRIQVDTLSPSLRDQLQPVGQALPLAQLGLDFAPLLPDTIEDLQLLAPYTKTQPDKTALTALGPLLTKTRGDIAALRSAAAPLLATIANSAGGPGNPDLAAVEPLLGAAADLSAAAADTYQALAPILLQRDGSRPISVEIADQLVAARPRIEAARQAARRASADWDRIPIDNLSPALRDRLRPIGGMSVALRDGIELALALPGLLGANGPVDYMLLAQNSDELRATGGFIGADGVLTIDRGHLSNIVMEYSPRVDDVTNQVYPDPPAPLLRYMNIELWLFRDANWSPDFPTSAKVARDLYKRRHTRDIANVVAFDQAAAQLMLSAIGPVTVQGSRDPISAANVLTYLRDEHDVEKGQADPKAYIGRLASAMIARIETRPGDLDLWALASAFRRALDERHLLIAVQDPHAAPIFARHGWDGAVRPGAADFLMVVDTNMGYNKVNPNITESISYTVDLRDPSAPLAELTVRHTHMLQPQGTCQQFVDQQDGYAGWMRRCYYDYLRVLAPRGAQLLDSTTQPVPDAWMDSGQGDDGAVKLGTGVAGTSELNTFLVVPFGAQRAATFRYRLPAAVLAQDAQGWHYRLAVQKQAGTGAIPFALELRLPEGARLVSTNPGPVVQDGKLVRFALSLAQDQSIDIAFERQ